MHTCDIIIPTYNSAATLPLTLKALFSQTVPAGWTPRLVISDDGSSDATLKNLKQHTPPPAWLPTIMITNFHTGAAGARNRALSTSQADVVFFLGADIILLNNCLAAHLNFHFNYPDKLDGALGLVKWDPRLKPTPFMEWMVHGGPQNNYDALLGQAVANPAHFFYGSHLSLKKTLFNSNSFPTVYRHYGWEDIDLGRQLASLGFSLHVLQGATALHRHYYSAQDIARRQYQVGHNITIYQQRYPAINIIPTQTKPQVIKYQLLSRFPLINILHSLTFLASRLFSIPFLFCQTTSADFWRGVRASQNNTFSP